MLTDEELPPVPKFSVTKWMFSGLMLWSLFFGSVGGLGILLLADFGPEKINPTRELKENVTAVDGRISQLEQRTQRLQDEQVARQEALTNGQQNGVGAAPDTALAKIVIGLTQLKTAYENDASLSEGIATLKSVVKDQAILKNLEDLQKMTADNFPSKEKILQDLQALSASDGNTLQNEKGEQPMGWRARAKLAASQLVRITPTKNITNDKDVARVQQAVAGGDYGLAKKFSASLPANPAAQVVIAEINMRNDAENILRSVVSQIGSAMSGTSQGSLY